MGGVKNNRLTLKDLAKYVHVYTCIYINVPREPCVLNSAATNLSQVGCFQHGQSVMNHTPWIDVGGKWTIN